MIVWRSEGKVYMAGIGAERERERNAVSFHRPGVSILARHAGEAERGANRTDGNRRRYSNRGRWIGEKADSMLAVAIHVKNGRMRQRIAVRMGCVKASRAVDEGDRSRWIRGVAPVDEGREG